MFVVKLLGLLDLLTGIILVLYHFDLAGTRFLASFIVYLIAKAVIFRGDLASIIDLTIALYMILMIFQPITILTIIAAIYLFQKAFVSITA